MSDGRESEMNREKPDAKRPVPAPAAPAVMTDPGVRITGSGRRVRAREIVACALLTALVVCVHLFFHVTIPFQAGTALVILSGATLGPLPGLAIGALSRFFCNFYLLQGAWTPWQMLSWGLLGFLAGLAFTSPAAEDRAAGRARAAASMSPVRAIIEVAGAGIAGPAAAALSCRVLPQPGGGLYGLRTYLFGIAALAVLAAGAGVRRRKLPAEPAVLAVWAFFLTFFVYGGIMNLAAAVTSAALPEGEAFSFRALRAVYLSGLPYDLYHAGTAAVMVFLLGNGFTRRIAWIRVRYGLFPGRK